MKTMVAVVAMAVAAGANAHDGMHGPGAKYDKDESGALTIDEYKAYLAGEKKDTSKAAAQFAALDTNKDGKLSSAELIKGLMGKSK